MVKMHTRVHRLIEDQGIMLMPGCYNTLSAAIVQNTGFTAGFISGYAVSASLLGKPDVGLLTAYARQTGYTCRNCWDILPSPTSDKEKKWNQNIMVQIQPINVRKSRCDVVTTGPRPKEDLQVVPCVESLPDKRRSGGVSRKVVAAVQDGGQIIPEGRSRFVWSLVGGEVCWDILPSPTSDKEEKWNQNIMEHAAKIASARDVFGDSDFFLVARTDARATSAKNDLSVAISRANLYMEDEVPRSDDELKEIGKRTKGYRVCNMIEGGVTPLRTPEELKAMGFHLIVHPLTSLYASARVLVDVLKILKEKRTNRDNLQKLATLRNLTNCSIWNS
ncbi:hypothetical protein JCGZ_25263 [Jatropha curcas]|uniref:Uncharacterized protein n=1 Tax=Jatropha curcas TaxID=180498 RepID=A0A067L3S1_JATCU|nr:hypothetical protein JCGZ_25263 [Jatropha curcas]